VKHRLLRRLAEPARRWGARLHARVAKRLCEQLSALTPEQTTEPPRLGLDDAEIEAACAQHGVVALRERISSRGATTAHLQRIAWHGSALADIACPVAHPLRERVLLDAALFNLAVALTDSLVDDEPDAGARAGRTLAPDLLERRLMQSSGTDAALGGGDESSDLRPLYALWDALLVSIGSRFDEDHATIARLAALLDRMHRSEFAAGEDRLAAKALPIEFVGALVRDGANSLGRAHEDLYRELGALIGLLDDWHDLALDMRHLRANELIYTHDGRGSRRAQYLLRGALRLVGIRGLAEDVVRRIGAHTARVLALAESISPQARANSAAYLQSLFEC
jgi:hypothetical protein